jgi:hypothetical protein
MFAIAQSVIEISNAHQSAAALGLLSSFIAGPLCALRQALTAPASEAQCAGGFLPRRGLAGVTTGATGGWTNDVAARCSCRRAS